MADFQLIHIAVDEAKLKGASPRQRNQFVGCMHAHNELAFLNRLLLFTINDTGDGELHDQAQFVQVWSVIQILAGKLYETWAMIVERFLKSNPPDLVSRLEASQTDSLQWLIDYFGKDKPKDSALKTVRDKTAFHYDKLDLTGAGDSLASSDCNLYLAQHPANSLYLAGSALVFHAISALIAKNADGAAGGTQEDRVRIGADIARRDAAEANLHMHNLLYGLIRLLMDDILGPPPKDHAQAHINILDAPKPSQVGIPAFIDIGPGRKPDDEQK